MPKPEYRKRPVSQNDRRRRQAQQERLRESRGVGSPPGQTVSRLVEDYLKYAWPAPKADWLDWRNEATAAAGLPGAPVTTSVFTHKTPQGTPARLSRYGIGYALGSAGHPNWDWFLFVNGELTPTPENQPNTLSIACPTPIDRDLLEIYRIVPPETLVEFTVVNQGVAIDVFVRVVGWYI